MTFTEAAIEVLRLAKKPLHYRKITKIAVDRQMLSHVGRTPETTMSARLTTALQRGGDELELIKIKPGVFGLTSFSKKVLKEAEDESGMDLDEKSLPPVESKDESDEESKNGGSDEPTLLAAAAQAKREKQKEQKKDKKKKDRSKDAETKKKRRRKSKESAPRPKKSRASSAKDNTIRGDFSRRAKAGEPTGSSLADEVEALLAARKGKKPCSFLKVSEILCDRKILSGDPKSLVPTVAACLKADIAQALAKSAFPRFQVFGTNVYLNDWFFEKTAIDERNATNRHAKRQRQRVRQQFLNQLRDLSTPGFMELIATWLGAEGVSNLRAIAAPKKRRGVFHLTGTWSHGPRRIPLAIIVMHSDSIGHDDVMIARGTVGHYGQAQQIWIVSTQSVARAVRKEADQTGVTPVTLFSGVDLSRAFARLGIGLLERHVSILDLDVGLMESLRGPRVPGLPEFEHEFEEPAEEAIEDDSAEYPLEESAADEDWVEENEEDEHSEEREDDDTADEEHAEDSSEAQDSDGDDDEE